jgi:hypothetical protein
MELRWSEDKEPASNYASFVALFRTASRRKSLE